MTEILQLTSILLKFNIFLKRCETKSKANPSPTTYLKYNLIFIVIILMFEFYYIAFREHVIAAKSLLDYTNLSSPNDYQYNDKIVYLRSLKANTAKEKLSLDIRLKNRWNKKLLFRSIKHYDLMCEKNKSVQVFKLLQTIYCFSFCCQWLCFNFCICFISWCFCRYLNSMGYKNNGDLPCQL